MGNTKLSSAAGVFRHPVATPDRRGTVKSYAPDPSLSVILVSANHTIGDTDGTATVMVTTGASNITVTLPASANNVGRVLNVIKADAGSGEVTVASADNIAGTASVTLSDQFDGTSVLAGNGTYTPVGGGSSSGGGTPLGSIIAVDDRFGTIPASGTISPDGYAVCNGQAVAGLVGNDLVGAPANLPDLTDGRFLRGAATAGGTGGANSRTLSTANIPSHTHGAGNFATSINISGSAPSLTGTTTFAAAGHTHSSGSIGADINLSGGRIHSRHVGPSFTSTEFRDGLTNGTSSTTGHGVSVGTHGNTGGNSSNASVGITGGSYSRTGSNSVTGTSGSAGSGTAFDNQPQYLDCVYLMKVKN